MFYVTEVVGHVNYIFNTNGLVELLLGFIQNIFPNSDSGHYQFPYIIKNYQKDSSSLIFEKLLR